MTRLPLLAGLALAGSLFCTLVGAADLTGNATAIDGDTIVIGSTHIRLAEIDAPERAQSCGQPAWSCGSSATQAMRAMLAEPVTCMPRSTDRYGRTVAVCRNGKGDLAEQLVRLGLGVVWPRYSTGRYESAQAAAQREHAGIWSGSFTMPWDYRHQKSP